MKFHIAKKILRTVCFLMAFLFVFGTSCAFLERKTSRERYAEFWSEPDAYDVWFLGTSHMYYAVQPMDLWKEYGIRSYNLAAPASLIPQVYWTLKNALNYGRPKAVVVDCYHIERDFRINTNKIAQMHTGLDSIPLSRSKFEAVFDLFDTTELRMEFLFDFYMYHNRWEEIGAEDFKPEYSVQKGALLSSTVNDVSGRLKPIDQTDKRVKETDGYVYFRKIIELCQSRNIPVILTSIPFCAPKSVQRILNGVSGLSEEYRVPFLNLTYEPALSLDYQTDFWDWGHVNRAGAKKITHYIGSYLNEQLNLQKTRPDQTTEQKWNDAYLVYRDSYTQWIREEENLNDYLTWLSDEAYFCEIYQNENINPAEDPILEKLLRGVNCKTSLSYEDAVSAAGNEFTGDFLFIVKDAFTGETLDTAIFLDKKRRR